MKTILADTCGSDWTGVSSVEYSLDKETLTAIQEAQKILKENPILEHVTIDGRNIIRTVKVFDSTIDDDERKEIERGDIMDFQTDVHQIIVFKGYSNPWFRADGKHDNSSYYEFEIELQTI